MTSARIWRGTVEADAPPEQQFGFGVHQWGLHASDDQVIAEMVEPFPGLYTCGEAFSDYQGWVEGALRSADLVLDRFDIQPIGEVYCNRHGTTANEVVADRYRHVAAGQIREYIDPDFGMGPASAGFIDLTRPDTVAGDAFGIDLTFFDMPTRS